MSDEPSKSLPESVPEAELRQVIARALEIDGELADRIPMDTLREIARELDISDQALEAALQEQEAPAGPVRRFFQRVARGLRQWGPAAPILGLGVGVLFRLLRSLMLFGLVQVDALMALLILAGAALLLALDRKPKWSQLLFQLKNLALWLGFTLGWSLVHGEIWGDLIVVVGGWWAGAALMGGVVSGFRNRGPKRLEPGGPPALPAPAEARNEEAGGGPPSVDPRVCRSPELGPATA